MADWKKLFDETVAQVGDAAQAAGKGLRQAASGAGKVVGIGVGTIEVRTARSTYRLGQTLRGAVILRLEQPTAASGLMVVLQATRGRMVRHGQTRSYQHEVVHEFSTGIAGEQTYESGEHAFELELPRELERRTQVGGMLGRAVEAARALESMTAGRLRWQLVATLVIPWKRNLSKAFDINVFEELGEPEAAPPPSAPPRKTAPAAPPKAEAPPSAQPRKTAPAAPPKAEAPQPATAPAAPPKTEAAPPEPAPLREPIPLPAGWAPALSRTLCALQGLGWVVIHSWAGAPVKLEVVQEVLGRHPDLEPEILLFHGVMDGFELVMGKPLVPRGSYESVRLARELAASHGGPLGALGELAMHSTLGGALQAEFVMQGQEAVRVLELPTLERLLDDSEDFMHRDGHSVIFGAVVLGSGDYLGITRGDELRRWREPAAGSSARAGYYDHCARSYRARLSIRSAVYGRQPHNRKHSSSRWRDGHLTRVLGLRLAYEARATAAAPAPSPRRTRDPGTQANCTTHRVGFTPGGSSWVCSRARPCPRPHPRAPHHLAQPRRSPRAW